MIDTHTHTHTYMILIIMRERVRRECYLLFASLHSTWVEIVIDKHAQVEREAWRRKRRKKRGRNESVLWKSGCAMYII